MAGSLLVAVKRKIIADLGTLVPAALQSPDVNVEYAYNASVTARDRIFCGRARSTHDPASLKTGRTFRNERMTLELLVVCEMPGGTAEDAEDRAVNILGPIVEEYIGDNRTLGGTIAGLNWIVVSGLDVTSMFNDRGHIAEAAYELTYDARLT